MKEQSVQQLYGFQGTDGCCGEIPCARRKTHSTRLRSTQHEPAQNMVWGRSVRPLKDSSGRGIRFELQYGCLMPLSI